MTVLTVKAGCKAAGLILSTAITAGAQDIPRKSPVLTQAPKPTINRQGDELQVTIGPAMARCRTLLSDIARLAHVEIRNLDLVSDDPIYVEFSAEPVASVIQKLLDYGKVDFVIRGYAGTEPTLVVIAEHTVSVLATTSLEPSPAQGAGDEPAVQPPAEDPESVQLGPAPEWQPLDVAPELVELPRDMTANGFFVMAPPPVPAAKRTNAIPTQSPVKQ